MKKYSKLRCVYSLVVFFLIRFAIDLLWLSYIPCQILWNLECRDKDTATPGKKNLGSSLAIKPIVSRMSFKTHNDFQAV